MRMGWMVVVALAIGLGGCASGSAPAPHEPPPQNYREQVSARVKKTFFDPYSIRDAAISRPFRQGAAFDGITLIPHSGWMVCVRANAKNRMGGYVGLTETGYMFRGETIVDADFKGHFCAGAAASYEPFPEIDVAAQVAAPVPGPPPKRR